MREADFRCDWSDLPPERTRKSLGAKYLIDPIHLKPFRKLRKRFYTVLMEEGIQDELIKGTFFVPSAKVAEVCKALDAIKAEYNAKADEFADLFETRTQEWALENPEFSAQILAASSKIVAEGKPDPARGIRSRFGCDYQAFQMSAIPGHEQQVEERVKGLIGPILRDASAAAKETLEMYVKGNEQDKGGRRLRSRIVRIVGKLQSLSCVNGNLYALVEKLKPVVDSLPDKKTGFVGQEFYAAVTILNVLSSQDLMQAVAEGRADLAALTEALRVEREQEHRRAAPENGLLAPAVMKDDEDGDPLDALW